MNSSQEFRHSERQDKVAVTSAEKQAAFDDWVKTLPERMATAIASDFCGLASCYRLKDDETGHYALYSFEERSDEIPVTVKMLHGSDSRTPGILVFGVHLDQLVICDCGKWTVPTPQDLEETAMKIAVIKAQRRGLTNPSTKDNPMDVATQTVVCSCGDSTMLTKNRANDPFEAVSPRWKFRTDPASGLKLGWYCGQEGHYQADASEVRRTPRGLERRLRP
jgi:hypothetical protein